MTVWQNVMLTAELRVGRRRRTERGAELLDMFGLGDRRRQKGRELSKGLRQRLMLCAALVSDPDILFLDEPTSGLDVASAHLIREIVVRLNREREMTVFITTHNLIARLGVIEPAHLFHMCASPNPIRKATTAVPAMMMDAVCANVREPSTCGSARPSRTSISRPTCQVTPKAASAKPALIGLTVFIRPSPVEGDATQESSRAWETPRSASTASVAPNRRRILIRIKGFQGAPGT